MNGAVLSRCVTDALIFDSIGSVQIPTTAPATRRAAVDCVKYSTTSPTTAPAMSIRRCSPDRASRLSTEKIEATTIRNNASISSGSDLPTPLPYVEPVIAPDTPNNAGATSFFRLSQLTSFVLIVSVFWWPDGRWEMSCRAELPCFVFAQCNRYSFNPNPAAVTVSVSGRIAGQKLADHQRIPHRSLEPQSSPSGSSSTAQS